MSEHGLDQVNLPEKKQTLGMIYLGKFFRNFYTLEFVASLYLKCMLQFDASN